MPQALHMAAKGILLKWTLLPLSLKPAPGLSQGVTQAKKSNLFFRSL
jgi:hypothetical protein